MYEWSYQFVYCLLVCVAMAFTKHYCRVVQTFELVNGFSSLVLQFLHNGNFKMAKRRVIVFKNDSEDMYMYILSVSSLACKLHMNTNSIAAWTNCHQRL